MSQAKINKAKAEVESFLGAMGASTRTIDSAVNSVEFFEIADGLEFLRLWLGKTHIRLLVSRLKPNQSFSEFSEGNQRIFRQLAKYPNLSWLNKHFGLTVDRGNQDVVAFRRKIEMDDFKLPTGLRAEILKAIKKYEV